MEQGLSPPDQALDLDPLLSQDRREHWGSSLETPALGANFLAQDTGASGPEQGLSCGARVRLGCASLGPGCNSKPPAWSWCPKPATA
jgi:hypothetical protein